MIKCNDPIPKTRYETIDFFEKGEVVIKKADAEEMMHIALDLFQSGEIEAYVVKEKGLYENVRTGDKITFKEEQLFTKLFTVLI